MHENTTTETNMLYLSRQQLFQYLERCFQPSEWLDTKTVELNTSNDNGHSTRAATTSEKSTRERPMHLTSATSASHTCPGLSCLCLCQRHGCGFGPCHGLHLCRDCSSSPSPCDDLCHGCGSGCGSGSCGCLCLDPCFCLGPCRGCKMGTFLWKNHKSIIGQGWISTSQANIDQHQVKIRSIDHRQSQINRSRQDPSITINNRRRERKNTYLLAESFYNSLSRGTAVNNNYYKQKLTSDALVHAVLSIAS